MLEFERTRLADRLLAAMRQRLDASHVPRSAELDRELGELVSRAAARMRDEGVSEDEGHIRAAEASAMRLADALIEHRRRARDRFAVEALSVRAGLKDICPLWPFC